MIATPTEVHQQNVPIIVQQCRITIVLNIAKNRVCGTKEKKKSCGFHLSRSKWDPYPWVGYVDAGSIADLAGLRAGDCLLDIDGTDIVGLRVKEIASLIKDHQDPGYIRIQVWRSLAQSDGGGGEQEDGVALAGPLPEVAKKLAKAVSGTVRALECPVCLESAASPVSQCVHGHILCVGCRAKTPRCPVCRVRLGQGRCLLADQVQRNIREAFEDDTHLADDDSSPRGAKISSLREKLFGKVCKNSSISVNENSSAPRISSARVKSSLTRLLLGGFDKAASAENLSVASLVDGESPTTIGGPPASYRRLGELSQNDRTKSASTGELSRGSNEPPPVHSSIYNRLGARDRVHESASGLLSVPQTPTWGGSTDSMSNNASFVCPLSKFTSCREVVSANILLEHLARTHGGPQVHFYGRTATIPLPLPFDRDSTYVLHHRGELFFFQYEEERAWISGTGTENLGEWTMFGQDGDGTRVKLRRPVTRLDDPSAPQTSHSAPLPRALGISTISIELIDSRSGGEGLEL